MPNFIEEFYFGNIEPQARGADISPSYQKALALLSKNEILLLEKLAGEEKQLFLAYVNACDTVGGESSLDSFLSGFRLGARFMQDTFCAVPFQNYLKENPGHY